jgi:hypothetical protein
MNPRVMTPYLAILITSACLPRENLNQSDLEHLCQAAQKATAEVAPKPADPGRMIALASEGKKSVPLSKLLVDLGMTADKGTLIAQRRAEVKIAEFECPALEAIYPGATTAPMPSAPPPSPERPATSAAE